MSGPFDLEINNIKTNLNSLIEKYTNISREFDEKIKKQNEKIKNNMPLNDVNYSENLERYQYMKNYQYIILYNINEIKTNLATLESIVVDTNNLGEQYMNVLKNRHDYSELVNKLNETKLNKGGKKHCKKTKKNLRSRRFRKSKSVKQKKHNKKYIGGDYAFNWLAFSELNDEDKDNVCPICKDPFSETQEKALYKTDCNHIFHNDCLVDVCLHKYDEFLENDLYPLCPICRARLDTNTSLQSLYIVGFQFKKLDNKTIQKYCSPNAKNIYYAKVGDDDDDDDDDDENV